MRDDYGSTCLCKTDRNRIDKIMDSQELMDSREVEKARNNKGVSCLVLGIIEQIVCLFPFFGFVVGIIGLMVSIKGLINNDSKVLPLIGLILSAAGVATSIFIFIITIMMKRANIY